MHDKPQNFIILRQNTYAVIADPIAEKKNPKTDKHGSIIVRHGEQEIRTEDEYPEPFPLYPGEILKKIDNLTIIPRDCALKIKANKYFETNGGEVKHEAGDEWLIYGPTIYTPRIEEDKGQLIQPITIEKNSAIKLRAKLDCTDSNKKPRSAGEEWLVRDVGHYLLRIQEQFVEKVDGIILTDKTALHLTATRTFQDEYGITRKAGEEWLITRKNGPLHICEVYERVVEQVDMTVLQKNEHCYKLNPLENGVNQMGKRVLITGPCAFFLGPGESLDGGIKKNYVLAEDEGLLMKAVEKFVDPDFGEKNPGDWWMVLGPRNYVPPVEVEVVENRKAIPLDAIEGIYVREFTNGTIRAVTGHTYILQANEELYKKELPADVNKLLKAAGMPPRAPYSVVTYKVPYNTAVQIYDYKTKESRVAFGPDLVMLNPDEQFTVNYLSGGTPKKAGKLVTLALNLGPNFSTDIIEKVETSDHARLEIRLSYNWKFIYGEGIDGSKIFGVRDCIGDMCSSMASKIRATVATLSFDAFHKSSARTIRRALFGLGKDGHVFIISLSDRSKKVILLKLTT